MKLTNAISQILPLEAIFVPTFAPICCIDISAPRVKTLIPATRNATPIMNRSIFAGDSGATVKLSAATISAIGKTELNDSLSFSFAKPNISPPHCTLFQHILYIIFWRKSRAQNVKCFILNIQLFRLFYAHWISIQKARVLLVLFLYYGVF